MHKGAGSYIAQRSSAQRGWIVLWNVQVQKGVGSFSYKILTDEVIKVQTQFQLKKNYFSLLKA